MDKVTLEGLEVLQRLAGTEIEDEADEVHALATALTHVVCATPEAPTFPRDEDECRIVYRACRRIFSGRASPADFAAEFADPEVAVDEWLDHRAALHTIRVRLEGIIDDACS